jgi:phosphatidate phosphatase APP1
LYEPLAEFLFEGEDRFPRGSMHLKNVRKNLLSRDTWGDISELLTNDKATLAQKSAQIESLLKAFPKRRFILIGDTGESDPEMYFALKEKYPQQIQEIILRDVTNDRQQNPDRLKGATIIPAETIVRAKDGE